MTIRLSTPNPVVDAVPGAVSNGVVLVINDGARAAEVTIRVVGLSGAVGSPAGPPSVDPGVTVTVDGGSTVECAVPVPVPIDIAVGQHAAAFQAAGATAGDDALVPFTVSIESVDKVDIVIDPSPVRGRRRAKFVVALANDEPTPVAFTLDADAVDVDVRFKTPAFRLLPGERTTTVGKVRGPRHLVGEPIQHNLVVGVRGRAAISTVTTPFIQRPLLARRFKGLLAFLAVIALWLGAIGGVALWLDSRNDDEVDTAASAGDAALVQLYDASGDPLENGPYVVLADGTIVDADGQVVDGFSVNENGVLVDEDGDPVNGVFIDPDTNQLVDANGTPIGAPLLDQDGNPIGSGSDSGSGGGGDQAADGSGGVNSSSGGSAAGGAGDDEAVSGITAPTETLLRGTVNADGVDDLSAISITLTPLALGEPPPPDATVLDAPGGTADDGTPADTTARRSTTKMWSARHAPQVVGAAPIRQSEPVEPRTASVDADGVWLLQNVQLRRTYELSFASEGYDTQSFVIQPPDDGSAVELDVTLEPSRGRIAGVVVQNGQPLGGVSLELSDGVLTFTTTSSTDGDIGTFAFDAVSTPGIYTLRARQDGYGTEVLQLPLTPGQQIDDVTVSMESGVGAIGGIVVDGSGAPVGGVTVTASNGEITRTTTTLTDGARGTYNIPQLDIPGTYTVRVEGDGYLTQTRRVPLNGSLGGVNFSLVRTSSRLAGLVESQGGGGIVGAQITLSTGNLEFDVASAATPRAGSYAVEDLPAGSYTVTFEHFQHETVTELIEIVAGVDPPPLDVVMPTRTRGIEAGFGSLVVEVIDPAAEETELREVKGATVRLVTRLTGKEFATLTDTEGSFTFEFSDVPVGTYTVLVTAPNYNAAPAQTVSVGRSQERVTVNMFGLGAASGSMIDSLTGETITGYTVKFFEVLEGGGDPREVPGAAVNVEGSGDGQWATAPRVLPTGVYLLEVSDAGGYAEPTDQILDPDLPPMQFRVEFNSGEATVIPTLVANRYPDVFGRVYEPVLIGGPEATTTGTQFRAIDDPTLDATLSCDGGPPVKMTIGNEFGSTADGQNDAFSLTRQQVDTPDLLGDDDLPEDCEITVTADGYVTGVFPLPDLKPTDGVSLPDRVVTGALVRPADDLGGRVFWIDPRMTGVELPLEGVEITGEPITSITPTDAGPPPPGVAPTVATEELKTASEAGGLWTLPGQIFGGTRYTFSESRFQDGLLDVVIDEDQNRAITGVTGMIVTEEGTNLKVQLEPPNRGQVSGQVTILTNDTPQFGAVGLQATNPFSAIADEVSGNPTCDSPEIDNCIARDDTDGSFEINRAASGTWTVDFELPNDGNHIFYDPPGPDSAPSTVEQLVGPEEFLGGFDTTMVELGTMSVEIQERPNSGAPFDVTPNVTLTLRDTSNVVIREECFKIAGADGCSEIPTDGVYTIDQIPVDATNPRSTPTTYRLEIAAGGYDQNTADVVVNDITDEANPPVFVSSQTGSQQISIPVRAGDKINVEVDAEPFGNIEASAFGEIKPCAEASGPYLSCPADAYEELQVDPDPLTDPGKLPLRVTAVPVFINGTPDGSVNTDLVDISETADGFRVSGPEGYYRISVAQDDYDGMSPLEVPEATDDRVPDGLGGFITPCTGIFCTPSSTPGVYRLENGITNDLAGQFTLQLNKSAIDLTAVESLSGGAAVGSATYTLTSTGNGSQVPYPYTSDPTTLGTDGTLTLATITPGDYQLRLDKAGHFPALVSFTVDRSLTGDPQTTVTVVAPLPQNNATITGDVVAQNEFDDPVPIAALTVDLAFAEPPISVDLGDGAGASTVPNEEIGEDNESLTPASARASSMTYTFTNVAFGTNTLVFSEPTGYEATFDDDTDTSEKEIIRTITAVGPTTIPDLIYDVQNVATVGVDVLATGGDAQQRYPNITAELRYPGWTSPTDRSYTGTLVPTPTNTDNPPPLRFEFSNVPPHTDPYTLFIKDDLHGDLSASVEIDVDVDADGQELDDVTMPAASPAIGRLRGNITRDDGTGPGNTVAATSLKVYAVDTNGNIDTTNPPVAEQTNQVTQEFSFDLAPGAYRLVPEETGYFATAATSFDATVIAGRIVDRDVALIRGGQVNVTIDPVVRDAVTVTLAGNGETFNATRDGTTNIYRAVVPAGFEYTVTVQSPTLAAVTKTTNGTVTSTVPKSVTFTDLRELTVVFNDTGGSPNNATRTVKVYDASDDSEVATLTSTGTRIVNGQYEYVFEEASFDAFGTAGDVYIVAWRGSASTPDAGFRPTRVDVPTGYEISVDVTVLATASVSGTLTDDTDPTPVPLTSIDGATVTIAAAGASVGQPPASVPLTSQTTTAGAYTFPGLSTASDGDPVTYELSADVPGAGIGSTTVTVTGTSSTSVTGTDIELTPLDVALNFTVQDEGGTGLPGSTIDFTDTSITDVTVTNSDGTIQVTVPEDKLPAEFTVTGPDNGETAPASTTDYVASGALNTPAVPSTDTGPTRDALTVTTVQLATRTVDVTFEIRVEDGDPDPTTGALIDGITVTLTNSPLVSPDDAATSPGASGTGTVTFTLPVTYANTITYMTSEAADDDFEPDSGTFTVPNDDNTIVLALAESPVVVRAQDGTNSNADITTATIVYCLDTSDGAGTSDPCGGMDNPALTGTITNNGDGTYDIPLPSPDFYLAEVTSTVPSASTIDLYFEIASDGYLVESRPLTATFT